MSAPRDCQAEREAVSRVLDELNRTVGERERIFLIAVSWEDIPPSLGKGPQAVIDAQLGEYNILVGIMWMRFGTPIPDGEGSGTVHEVQQAIDSWERIGEPRVMFYFKEDPPNELSDIDIDERARVRAFRSRLQTVALTHSFKGTAQFESILRQHLNKVVQQLIKPAQETPIARKVISVEPYDGFFANFREVVSAQRIPGTDALIHIVFGSLADIRDIAPAIPVGQAFDFNQRGQRSVLASFDAVRVNGKPFFDAVGGLWPVKNRPKAAGLGHTKYLALPQNSHNLPGVFFVVTTRDLSTSAKHYGRYVDTPIEGIDFIIDQLIQTADLQGVAGLAMPLLGTGYANIMRTKNNPALGGLLRRVVALLSIQRVYDNLQKPECSIKRVIIVIYSPHPQTPEEHALWNSVTRYLVSRPEQRSVQLAELVDEVTKRFG